MYVLQLFQMQYFAFFVIANLPDFVLNLLGWSGENLRFLILWLSFSWICFGIFSFLFIYLFIYIFYRNGSNKPSDHKFRCTTIIELKNLFVFSLGEAQMVYTARKPQMIGNFKSHHHFHEGINTDIVGQQNLSTARLGKWTFAECSTAPHLKHWRLKTRCYVIRVCV